MNSNHVISGRRLREIFDRNYAHYVKLHVEYTLESAVYFCITFQKLNWRSKSFSKHFRFVGDCAESSFSWKSQSLNRDQLMFSKYFSILINKYGKKSLNTKRKLFIYKWKVGKC